jgi:transcriptional regulator with PAS, ATPase and Fis domain
MIHHKSELPCHSYGEDCPMQRVMETGDRHQVRHIHHNREHYPECVIVRGSPVYDENGRRYLGEEIARHVNNQETAGIKSKQHMEAERITRLLLEHNGHRRTVADLLNISERTLYRKLVCYNLTDVGKDS